MSYGEDACECVCVCMSRGACEVDASSFTMHSSKQMAGADSAVGTDSGKTRQMDKSRGCVRHVCYIICASLHIGG